MRSSLIPAFAVSIPLRGLKLLLSNFSPDVARFTYVQPLQRSAPTVFVFALHTTIPVMTVPGLKPPIAKRVRYYAVHHGRNGFTGILNNWEQARKLTTGVSFARFKSFKSYGDAEAYLKVQKSTQSSTPNISDTTVAPGPVTNSSSAPVTSGTPDNPHIPIAPPDPADPLFPVHELYAGTDANQLAKDAPNPSDESPKELVVYTDGACSKNGGSGAKAGYAVYFGEENPYNVSEPLPQYPTNQRAEMTAVLEAMRITLDHGLVANKGKLVICTDSQVCLWSSWSAVVT